MPTSPVSIIARQTDEGTRAAGRQYTTARVADNEYKKMNEARTALSTCCSYVAGFYYSMKL